MIGSEISYIPIYEKAFIVMKVQILLFYFILFLFLNGINFLENDFDFIM